MTVLITGGAGFIGSHLTDRLVREGKDVVVLDDFSSGKRSNIEEKVKWSPESICNKDYLMNLFETYQFTDVFHLAAMSRVEPSINNSDVTYEINVTGTKNVLDAAATTGANVIYAGSSTYTEPYNTPYNFTKFLGEELVRFYSKRRKVQGAIARFGNVYGPRQHETGEYSTVIGIFERQLREGEKLTVTGSGKQKRDFVHVQDIVYGLIMLNSTINNYYDHYGDNVVEFGYGENHRIEDVAVMFAGPNYVFINGRAGEMDETLIDIEHAKDWLEWEPTIKLEEYIRWVKEQLIERRL
jgi:UDP-glucose 4-epimerase